MDGFAAVEILGDIKYEFIPALAVKWMKPDVIQEWDHEVVKQLALAFATNLGAYKRVKKLSKNSQDLAHIQWSIFIEPLV